MNGGISSRSELLALQQTLYTSKNPTRRWLHTSRREWIAAAISRSAAEAGASSALEVGPGSGIYLETLCDAYDSVVTSDVEPEFLDHARDLARRRPNLRVAVDDITATGLRPRSFDLVLCSEVVEHLSDVDGALAGIHSILKPGGHLIISTPQRYSPLETLGKIAFLPGVVRVARAIYREPIMPTGHINLMTRRTLERKLHATGFVVRETHLAGVYLPLLAELGGDRALGWAQRLEPRWRRGRLAGLLWTQIHVAVAAR